METGKVHALRRPAAGFTLLEMIIVLAVIALFSGLFAMRFGDSKAEASLTDASHHLRKMAHEAKSLSFTYKTDYFIVLESNSFRLTQKRPIDEPLLGAASDGKSVNIPAGVNYQVRLPNQRKWQAPRGLAWHFRSSGLCDPLLVRFSSGTSYVALDFNVLTGRADETSFFE